MKSKSLSRILVLGEDARMVLPIVRSLGRRGMLVDVGWLPQDSPVRHSRFLNRVHELPSFRNSCEEAAMSLRKLLARESFSLVIPVGEAVSCLLQQYRNQLGESTRIWLLEPETFAHATDKTAMHHLASRLGIAIPFTAVATSESEIESAVQQASVPVVVKPACSTSGPDVPKNYVEIHDDRVAAIQSAKTHLTRCSSVLIQSSLPGQGVGVEFIASAGNILTAFQHVRIHETTGHGSTYRMGQVVSQELLSATAALIRELQYTGVGMCEFRVDEVSGQWGFVELNPRFWGSLPLAVASGADFPWFLYQLLVEGVTTFPQSFKTHHRCRSLRSDLRWMYRGWRGLFNSEMRHCDQLQGWGINERSSLHLLADLMRILTFRDGVDTFAWDDTRPFFSEIQDLFCRRLSRQQRQIQQRRRPLADTLLAQRV